MAEWFFANTDNQEQLQQGGRDGTSPATAWTMAPNRPEPGRVVPEQLMPGDTLWVLDVHDWFSYNTHVALSRPGITIRGDYPGRRGQLRELSIGQTGTDTLVRGLEVRGRIVATGAHGLTLDGCTIFGGSKGFQVFDRSVDFDSGTIRYCTIHDMTDEGIEIFTNPGVSRDGWVVTHNHIFNVGAGRTFPDADLEGVGLQRVTNCLVQHNYIHHCDYGINLYESGMGISSSVVIADNLITDIRGGPSIWPSRGLFISGGSTTLGSLQGITIAGNRIYRVGRESIRLQAPPGQTGLLCQNNVVALSNLDIGPLDSERLVAPAEWVLQNNRLLAAPLGLAARATAHRR